MTVVRAGCFTKVAYFLLSCPPLVNHAPPCTSQTIPLHYRIARPCAFAVRAMPPSPA
jgi:hypothetical protein